MLTDHTILTQAEIPLRAAAGMQMWSLSFLKNNIKAIINVLAFVLCTRCSGSVMMRSREPRLWQMLSSPGISAVLAGISLTKKNSLSELVIIARKWNFAYFHHSEGINKLSTCYTSALSSSYLGNDIIGSPSTNQFTFLVRNLLWSHNSIRAIGTKKDRCYFWLCIMDFHHILALPRLFPSALDIFLIF